jgi:hypothetical protein
VAFPAFAWCEGSRGLLENQVAFYFGGYSKGHHDDLALHIVIELPVAFDWVMTFLSVWLNKSGNNPFWRALMHGNRAARFRKGRLET